MTVEEFVGPAVVAAVVSGVISLVSMAVNWSTIIQVSKEKLQADRDLAREKFNFDKEIGERKLARRYFKWVN